MQNYAVQMALYFLLNRILIGWWKFHQNITSYMEHSKMRDFILMRLNLKRRFTVWMICHFLLRSMCHSENVLQSFWNFNYYWRSIHSDPSEGEDILLPQITTMMRLCLLQIESVFLPCLWHDLISFDYITIMSGDNTIVSNNKQITVRWFLLEQSSLRICFLYALNPLLFTIKQFIYRFIL